MSKTLQVPCTNPSPQHLLPSSAIAPYPTWNQHRHVNKSYLTAVLEMFERMEYKKISTRRFQHVSLHTLLIQIFRPSCISEEISPESDFCLACTADDNIEHIAREVFK